MKHLMIDLYTGRSELVAGEYLEELVADCELVEGDRKVWRCEEYMVVEIIYAF